MFNYNTSIHKTTNFTAYELLFGFKAYLPSSITQEPKFHYTYDDYINSLKYRLNTSFKIAREHIINTKTKSKEHYDKKTHPKEFNSIYIYNKQGKVNLSKKNYAQSSRGPIK